MSLIYLKILGAFPLHYTPEHTEPTEKNLIPSQLKMVKLEYIHLTAADYFSE